MALSRASSVSCDDYFYGEYPSALSKTPLNELFQKLAPEIRNMIYDNLVELTCPVSESTSAQAYLPKRRHVPESSYFFEYDYTHIHMGIRMLCRLARDEFDARVRSVMERSIMNIYVRIPVDEMRWNIRPLGLDAHIDGDDCEPEYAHHPWHKYSSRYAGTGAGLLLSLVVDIILRNETDKTCFGFGLNYGVAKKAMAVAYKMHEARSIEKTMHYRSWARFEMWHYRVGVHQAALHFNCEKAFLVRLKLPAPDCINISTFYKTIRDLRYVADNGFARLHVKVDVEAKHKKAYSDFLKVVGGKVEWEF